MLLLDSARTIHVDGVTVYPDLGDETQYWYVNERVQLARRNDQDQFTLISYRPEVADAGIPGGGFLMFEVDLRLDPEVERKILSQLGSMTKGTPRLAPVPYEEGSVQCVALDLQGAGGTEAPGGPGTFRAVEQILGTTVPTLHGNNTASFSLTLSEAGATILKQAFEQGAAPVGVIYNLKYTGIRPALNVKITAHLERVYDQFKASLSGQYYFIKAAIEAGLEKLKQDGAIKIEVIDFSTAQDREQKEKWALDFFTNHLLKDWFTPTLAPGDLTSTSEPGGSGGLPKIPGLENVLPGNGSSTGGGSGQGGSTEKPASGEGSTVEKVAAGVAEVATGVAEAATGVATVAGAVAEAKEERKPAVLEVLSRSEGMPSDYVLEHTAASSGTAETITVKGGPTPVVKVGGQAKELNAARQFTLEVAAGASHEITVEYPKVAKVEEDVFDLRFSFDLPNETGFAATTSNAVYKSYLDNSPNPSDPAFLNDSKAKYSDPAMKGAEALRDWIRNRLADPKQVRVEGHASYEGIDTPEKQSFNQRLSERRLQVAEGIIGSLATVTEKKARGFEVGRAVAAADATKISRPEDRAAKIIGKVDTSVPAATIKAKISRPAGEKSEGGGETKPPEEKPKDGDKPKEEGSGGIPGEPQVSFKLKFIHKEEQKTIILEYNRAEAIQRTANPQGFFGLLLADLEDRDKHFVDVDLANSFFQKFTVTLDAPVDFQRIGLASIHAALDYGDPADPENLRHGDFVFDPQDAQEKKFEVFMNAQHDMAYRFSTQFHYDPTSGWEGSRFTYELPQRLTEDRTLLLNPFDVAGFLELSIFPHRIDRALVDSTDVHLEHTNPDGAIQRADFIVLPDSPPQTWKLRLDDPKDRSYTYTLVHHLKDGTERVAGPETSSASALPIEDPFERPLEIDFFPAFDPATVKTVIVDVEYDDLPNNYSRQERLTLTGEARDPAHLQLSLIDPNQRQYRFRLTIIGVDNQVRRGPFVETTDTLIVIEG